MLYKKETAAKVDADKIDEVEMADVNKAPLNVEPVGNKSDELSAIEDGEANPPVASPPKVDNTQHEGGESDALKAIIAYESTNLQYQKLLHNWLLIAALTVISILKGPGEDSVIGTVRCTGQDWVLFCILQIVCIVFLVWGLVIVKKEFKAKEEAGY